MIAFILDHLEHEFSCAMKLCLYSAERSIQLNRDFFIRKFMKIPQSD